MLHIVLRILVLNGTKIELKYVGQYDQTNSLWSDFALYLQDYLMDKHHTLDIGSILHQNWPHVQVSMPYTCI